ncbi:hypothetical protein Skr01_65350 [Sphaerisporangium krabiense]|nr:hypothetical protein Skr01_65350 [Sphaerisporangium krabiense]
MLTGVCAGLGRATGMDPVIFRVGFAVLVVGSGIGIMLYVAAFLLMRGANGAPGYVEQWSRRSFDTETVMALLAAVFALGLVINLAADGIGTATVIVGTLLAIALLAAHARGVDLLAVAKSLPERVRRRAEEPVGDFQLSGSLLGRPFGQAATAAFAQAAAPADAPAAPPSDAPPPRTPPTDAPVRDAPVRDAPSPGPGRMTPEDFRQAAPGEAPRPAYRPAPEYRRLSDLAREARPGGFDSSGEPFAPHGPYGFRGPNLAYEPHDWAHDRRATAAPARPKRPKSFIGGITMLAAFVVGGIMVATQSPPGTLNFPVVGASVLITIGAGLLVATWFGRGVGLVAAGTLMAVVLVAGSTVSDIPKRIGSYTWQPTDAAVAARTYEVGIGDGTLDLSDTKFAPGSRTRFDASVGIGEMKVIVPPTARVEVFGRTRLGDVKIEHVVQGGTDVQHDKVLEPDATPPGSPAVIELHVKAGIGDVEVRRAA